MNPAARRAAILTLSRDGARLEVEALAAALDASRETIRRDLAALDREGLLRRVHGGAVVPLAEGPFHDRMREGVAAKRAIARHMASLLRPGDSVFIDTGSTTLALAEEMASCKGLIVITNSADIASLCQKGEGARVILLGGEFRGPGRETLGPMAVAQIGQLRAGRALLTVAGLSERGAFDIDAHEAEVARAMVAQAEEVVILADGSKMGRAGVFEVCPMASIGRIVCDTIPGTLRAVAEGSGVTVDIVA